MSWDILPKAILQYFLQKIKAIIPTKTSDLTNDSGYTDNVGTITGITMNGSSKGTSGVVDLGTVVTDVSGKSDKSSTVSNVAYDTTNKKITKTINGTTSDVVAVSTLKSDMQLTKSDVGLSNVGNFKAVSTSSNQGLTDTEKSNARTNIDTPSNGDIQSSKTLKSSVVTVTDAAPINAEDITVDIEPIQDLHGYGRPWAGGAGKNLLKYPYTTLSFSEYGVTADITENYIEFTGTSTLGFTVVLEGVSGTVFGQISNAIALANSDGKYTFSGGSAKVPLRIRQYRDGNLILEQYVTTSLTIDVLATDLFEVGAYISIRTTFNDTIYPQFEKGQSATTYAPYSNICPIEGRTGAELDRVGENWLPMTVAGIKAANTGGTWSGNTYNYDGTIFEILTDTNDNVIGIKVNRQSSSVGQKSLWFSQSYIPNNFAGMILNGITSGSVTSYFIAAALSNNGSSWATENDVTTEDVTISNYPYIQVGIIVRGGIPSDGVIFYPMIRLASITDSTYEPYQGQQYTASFGETVYGGKWHVTEGGTDKTMVVVDFGDLSWSKIADSLPNSFKATISGKKNASSASVVDNILCSCYKTVTGTEATTLNNVIGGSTGNSIVYVTDSAYTDAVAFKTARTGQTICYELATPTTISTPEQNVPMLQGINTVYADCGDTSLEYQPDNVIGELKGEIRAVEAELAEVEENLEIVYEDHVANTSMGIIVDGYSVGDMPFSNALDIAKTGYTPIAVTDTSIVHSTVANQGEIATHCLLDVANNRVRFYVHVMDSAASLTIPPNSLTFRVAYKKA